MKRLLPLFMLLTIAACSKTNTNPNNGGNTNGGNNNPNNPNNPNTNNYSYLKPLPTWGADTFVCFNNATTPKSRIDSFYTSVGSNGESVITYKGQNYVIAIDSHFEAVSPYTEYYFSGVVLMNKLSDSVTLNKYQINYYPAYYLESNGDTFYRSTRIIDFASEDSMFNHNASLGYWYGRNR